MDVLSFRQSFLVALASTVFLSGGDISSGDMLFNLPQTHLQAVTFNGKK